MLVRFRAASCGGRSPTWQGLMPVRSTRHGTSTLQPSGRLVISPWLATLPLTRDGVLVTSEWITYEQYSFVRPPSIGSSPAAWRRIWSRYSERRASQFCKWLSLTERRPISLISSGRLRNHGMYSDMWLVDSVTK